MAITTAKVQAVTRGITQSFDNGVRTGTPLYNSLCTIVPSSSRDESYGWIGDVPKMREFLGERQYDQLRAFNYQLANKTFEQSLGVDRHDIEDDRYAHYSNIAEAMGREATRHPDELLVNLMTAAESAVCYDGQFFYDTDHAAGDSGTQSNKTTFNATDHTNVTVPEFKAAFHKVLRLMMQFKTDKGNFFMPRAITADLLSDLHLIVPLSLWEVAQQAMTQMMVAQSSVAVDNVLLAKAQVHPVLGMGAEGSGSDAKFQLLYTGGTVKPFIFQSRSSLVRQIKGATDIEDKLVKFMTEVRYNVGYGLWQYGYLCEFN